MVHFKTISLHPIMNCQAIIQVVQVLDTSIHTREAASQLMQEVTSQPCLHVELDFAGVEYISRSFADQFHFEKLECAEKNNMAIIVSNAAEPVFQMLQAVARTQQKTNRKSPTIPVYKYSSAKELENFLMSI